MSMSAQGAGARRTQRRTMPSGRRWWPKNLSLHVMLLPAMALLLVYNYIPIVGNLMAFERYMPKRGLLGSPWVGLDNFKYVMSIPGIWQVLWNTFYIAMLKVIAGIAVPVFFALLLNEMRSIAYKRTLQTIVYFPHFLSWVILAGVLIDILSPSRGIVGLMFQSLGLKAPFFLGDAKIFPYTLVVTETWKEFGFGTIVYLAALTGIDPTLYEAGVVDGANRWQQTVHITIPGILPIVMLMAILAMGNVLNAGFDQVFNLYSPQVYRTGDILDTLVYRIGLVDAQYGVATAVGLFKSIVSFAMLALSYGLAYRFTDYRVF